VLISVDDIVEFRLGSEWVLTDRATAGLPLEEGAFTAIAYDTTVDRREHVALVHGEIGSGHDDVAVRERPLRAPARRRTDRRADAYRSWGSLDPTGGRRRRPLAIAARASWAAGDRGSPVAAARWSHDVTTFPEPIDGAGTRERAEALTDLRPLRRSDQPDAPERRNGGFTARRVP